MYVGCNPDPRGPVIVGEKTWGVGNVGGSDNRARAHWALQESLLYQNLSFYRADPRPYLEAKDAMEEIFFLRYHWLSL
jgi:hypothetical protein